MSVIQDYQTDSYFRRKTWPTSNIATVRYGRYIRCIVVFVRFLRTNGTGTDSSIKPPDKCAYLDFFLFLNQYICCGYSKEPSQ